MRARRWFGTAAVLATIAITILACIAHDLVPCGETLCPTTAVCTPGGCASPAAATACEGKADGASCDASTIPDGTCNLGACYPVGCGNSIMDRLEVCDDGNTEDGDDCSRDCRSTESCGNQIVDLSLGEQCDVGPPGLSADGCSSRCVVEFELWREVSTQQPQSRTNAPLVLDSAGRLMLIGGSPISSANTALDEVFEWDGATWRRARSAQPLPAVSRASATYDIDRNRVVVFGGRNDSEVDSDKTWEWDGVTWIDRTPTARPPPRSAAAMAYDPVRRRVVMFGGEKYTPPVGTGSAGGGTYAFYGDTWEWDGATGTWAKVATSGPPAVGSSATMAFHPPSGTTVLFNGVSGSPLLDTWTWDGAAWTQRAVSAAPQSGAHAIGFDPIRSELLMLTDRGETWRLDATTWTKLAAPALPPSGTSLAFHSARARLAAFRTSQIWEWDGAAWQPATARQLPTGVDRASLDLDRSRLVAKGSASDTWEWDGASWEVRNVGGTSSTVDAAFAYDALRKQTVQFGGHVGGAEAAETWVYDGMAWTQRSPAVAPPARRNLAMVFDRARGVIVMFGGYVQGNPTGDTWTWDGVTWKQYTGVTRPPSRFNHGLAYDPARGRVVLFGGTGGTVGATNPLDDTWEWDGVTWEEKTPVASPPARDRIKLHFDPRRQRTVLISGTTSSQPGYVWEWDGTAWTERAPIVTINIPRIDASAIDLNGDLLVGSGSGTFRLRFESTVPPERCASATEDSDGDGFAGCADPDCWGRCSPSCLSGSCDPATAHCGDLVCNPLLETYALCPTDCPVL